MAHLIGGIAPWLGLDNHIFGTNDPDIVFGDPFTTDNSLGVFEIGGFLSSGQGGRDSLDGHGGDDTLFGDAWAISDQGRGGDDQLDGGAGGDTLYGDAFSIDVSDSAIVAGGNDRLSGGKGNDTLYGDGYNCLRGRGGDDWLDGGAGDDILSGDAFSLGDFFVGGNDRLQGGEGHDKLYGDGLDQGVVESGIGGDDHLYGGSGNDFLVGDVLFSRGGSGGNDLLDGGKGDDVLYGDAEVGVDTAGGDDLLIGGAGNDQLWGDGRLTAAFAVETGADQFLFARNSGRDEIFDFELDKDIIQIAGYGYDDFADFLSNIGDDADGNAVLQLNGTVDQVTLIGIHAADLSAANFVFANADFALV